MKLNTESIYLIKNVEDIKKFLIGGYAILTLESKITGKWFTYKIKIKDKNDSLSPLFVSVLTGTDNESSYTYLGTIFKNVSGLCFRLTKNSKISEKSLSYIVFNFFFNMLMNNRLHNDLNVYHRGICAVCGRTLTVPESLESGIGPTCRLSVEKSYKNLILSI